MNAKWIRLFLRFALGTAFLSAVADRYGIWPTAASTWENFESFLEYTAILTPWLPDALLPLVGWFVSILELVLGICLILGFKTRLMALISGYLLLLFGLSMAFTSGIKGPLDYSVFSAAAAAFALAQFRRLYFDLDTLMSGKAEPN